jgi:hypothetical protein
MERGFWTAWRAEAKLDIMKILSGGGTSSVYVWVISSAVLASAYASASNCVRFPPADQADTFGLLPPPVVGLEPLAIVFSLTYALLMWSYVIFISSAL